MEFNLNGMLLALLLSTSEPLSVKMIQDVVAQHHAQVMDEPEETEASVSVVPSLLTISQIRNAIEALNLQLETTQGVYRIVEHADGFQIAIVPQYASWVRLLRGTPKPLKLSQALLETLTIVAYRQPVTRAEIEAIRGVSVEGAVSRLTELELIHVTGRAELPGRPMQYSTTAKFLEMCGIASLGALPATDMMEPSRLTGWIESRTQPQEPATDVDVGLASEYTEQLTLGVATEAAELN